MADLRWDLGSLKTNVRHLVILENKKILKEQSGHFKRT